MNRHLPAAAVFGKNSSSWQGKTISLVSFAHEGCHQDPAAANSGVFLATPR
jgi:hypothetical protein